VSKLKILILWIVFCFSATLHAEQCSQSGQSFASEGWPKQLRTVCLTDSVKINLFRSPDQRKVIEADIGGFRLKIDGKSASWPEGKELMANNAEVSWSPISSAFFINYGDGSDLDGWTLKVYAVSDGHVVSHSEINQEIVRRFRADLGCPGGASDPNVRGLGWSKNGADIYAFAQATISQSCGQQGDFRGVAMSIAKGSVLSFYSEAETKAHFHNLLPYNMR
jgi:hypothetical protein